MFEVQEALEQQKMEFNRKVCHKSSLTAAQTWLLGLETHIAISLSSLMCCMHQLANHPVKSLAKQVQLILQCKMHCDPQLVHDI